MKRWAVQDAKARFSELLRATREEGPQTITTRGEELAVVVPIAEWRRLAIQSDDDPLLDPEPKFDFEIAPRTSWGDWRPPPTFDDE